MTQTLLFYAFAALITFCSFMVVTSKNPVASVIFLVIDLFVLAGIYAMMGAHFVAAIQILVYTGAIVVLFLFVIMLLNLGPNAKERLQLGAVDFGALILTCIGFIAITAILVSSDETAILTSLNNSIPMDPDTSNTYAVGLHLFTKYLWPFELASILILLAIVASVVIAKKDGTVKSTQ